MSRDFDKAQEMVWASMEYVKVLGFRLRRTEAQRDDWKQVAQSHADEMIKLRQCVDALKAERDAERMVHDEYKERNRELFNRNQRLTAELAVIKDERDALRSTTIDTAAGRLLDAFGSLANEPRNGATDDEYRDRIVRKIHSIKMERDALRAECDDLRRVFALVHGSLGIQQGEHIGNAIEALKKERDELMIQVQDMRAEIDALNTRIRQSRGEYDAIKKERDELNTRLRQSIARGDFAEMRATELTAEIERLKKPARQHPVAVGEWVERTESPYTDTPIGHKAQVVEVRHSTYRLSCGRVWEFRRCAPCDPPESTHDTPEGKKVAESVIRDCRKTEPKPGDTVRLVKVPTQEDYPMQSETWNPEWGQVGETQHVDEIRTNSRGTRVAELESGWQWPLSCIEIVEDAK